MLFTNHIKQEEHKQKMLDELSKDYQVLAVAYAYAKNHLEYGVDVTKVWDTATLNVANLERAYLKGRKDSVEKLVEVVDVLERVYKCPSELLDRDDALDKIMTTYKKIR